MNVETVVPARGHLDEVAAGGDSELAESLFGGFGDDLIELPVEEVSTFRSLGKLRDWR
jgi:hypothetical protein